MQQTTPNRGVDEPGAAGKCSGGACDGTPGGDGRAATADVPRISAAARGARVLVRGYQLVLSPLIGPRCRFLPTCSEYALEAFAVHGFLGGMRLTLRRLLRCHPLGGSGLDPVPERTPSD